MPKETFKTTEVWFKFILLAIFAFFYVMAIPFPEKSKQFPQLLASFAFVLILISLFIDLVWKKRVSGGELESVDDTETTVLDEAAKKARRKRYFKAWGILLASSFIGFMWGFIYTGFALFLGFALFFGPKKKLLKNAAIAVGVSIMIYLVFQRVMGVPLFMGIE